jgi:hypothetical protein
VAGWQQVKFEPAARFTENRELELGVRFETIVPGAVVGLPYYKGEGATGTHIGRLWSAEGVELAAATFSGESAYGWQEVLFVPA